MAPRAHSAPRVGLVLGAGGVMGAAWLTGALQAIAEETGWDPGSAELVVGTSAGSMIGSLIACGVPPWFLAAHAQGEPFPGLVDAAGRDDGVPDRARVSAYGLARGLPPIGPGSWRMIGSTLRHPLRHAPGAVVGGWLPRGFVSTEPLRRAVRSACAEDWAPHPGLRVMACDYATGRRVAFGREDAPAAALPDAVAASCAIPGFYAPVRIEGRRYVDGGLCSPSNADVLRGCGLDLVVVLSPMSSRASVSTWSPAGALAGRMRADAGRRLGHEARELRAEGTEVALLQPGRRDLEVLGHNLMSSRNRAAAVRTARETTAVALASDPGLGALRRLPATTGPLVARPEGEPAAWPRFGDLARERFAGAAAA